MVDEEPWGDETSARAERNPRQVRARRRRRRRRFGVVVFVAVAVGVFGFLLESMLHLVETGRAHEAPAHIPVLVTAVERMLAPPD